jgi:hypothetical protein
MTTNNNTSDSTTTPTNNKSLTDQSHLFQNVATAFGPTHIKDNSAGANLYLNCLDSDSEPVYKVLIISLEEVHKKYPDLYFKIENIFGKALTSSKILLEALQQTLKTA